MSEYKLYDKNGKLLEIGQTVKAKYCTGVFGQTETIVGELRSISDIHSLTIAANDFTYVCYPRFVLDASLGKNALSGCYAHNDYEHGHESYVEILKDATTTFNNYIVAKAAYNKIRGCALLGDSKSKVTLTNVECRSLFSQGIIDEEKNQALHV